MIKKAAMFGLDARIALAIFGALSVISGAALYSAIKQAKITAWVTEMQEIAKAYEQYYLDTGSQLPAKDVTWLLAEDLVKDNSQTGWNGPYLTYSATNDTTFTPTNFPDTIQFTTFANVDFGDSTTATACTASDCHAFMLLHEYSIEEAEAIDLMIDGSINHLTGNLKVYKSTDPRNTYWRFMDRNQ